MKLDCKVVKVGSSSGIYIPSWVMKALDIKKGEVITISIEKEMVEHG
ncbi:MAG: AbrB/MazE/SpoVT family DNA-binding domain-containing protein [Fusobacteriaceae bacterium]